MVNLSRLRSRKFLRLILRRVLQTVVTVLALVTLLLVLLYASGTFRSRAAGWGMEWAAGMIPGKLQIEKITWSQLGQLRLTNVVWTDGKPTPTILVEAPSLELAWSMGALQKGRVEVDRVELVAELVNLPGIQAVLQPTAETSEPPRSFADSVKSAAPLHKGALPGIPSLSIDQWILQCQYAVISPELTVENVDGAGSLELGFERSPRAEVEHLRLDLSLAVEDSVATKLVTVSVDRFDMAMGFAVEPGEKISFTLEAMQLEFDKLFLSSLLPATSRPPPEFDEVSGKIMASGSYAEPLITSVFDINLESTEWLESGRLFGSSVVDAAALPDSGFAAVAVKIDSLALVLFGSELFGQAELKQRSLNLQLNAALPDSQALMLIWPDSLAPPVVQLDLAATVAGTLQEFEIDLDLTGQLGMPQVTVPRIDLHAHGNHTAGSFELHMPRGISAGGIDIDFVGVEANFEQAIDRSFKGDYFVAVNRGQDVLRLGGHAQADSLSVAIPKTVVVDSLVYSGHGQNLRVDHIDWSDAGQLRLTNAVSTDETQAIALLQVPSLEVDWDMEAMQNGRLEVGRVELLADRLDFPAIEALVQSMVLEFAEKPSQTGSANSASPLHQGALPGIPSLSIDQWQVRCDLAVISPELTVKNVDGAGALELGFGRTPRAVVEHLQLDLSAAIADPNSEKIVTVSLDRFDMALGFVVEPDEQISFVLDAMQLEFGHLSLPPLLPATSSPPPEFDEVSGKIMASGSYAAPLISSVFDINLESTSWLENGRLIGSGVVDAAALPDSGLAAVAVKIDSLALSLFGSEVFAQGAFKQRYLDLKLRAAVPDSQALMLVWPDSLAPPIVQLDLNTTLAGTPQKFDIDLDLTGKLELPQIKAPQIAVHAHGNRSAGSLELLLPGGISTGEASLDSVVVVVNIEQAADRSLSGNYLLALKRDQDELRFGGHAQADSLSLSSPKTVVLDSLVFGGHGQKLRLKESTTLVMGPEPGFFSLSPFEFSGGPGAVNVKGEFSEAGIEFKSAISLLITEEQLNHLVPSEFWSSDGGNDFSLESRIEMGGTFAKPTIEGDLIAKLVPHRDNPDYGVALNFATVAGDSVGVIATMAITANDSTLLRAALNLPGEFKPKKRAWAAKDSTWAVLNFPGQMLHLGHLNRLLPPDIELVGQVQARFAANIAASGEGSIQTDPLKTKIDGKLVSNNLVINLPNRSRLDTNIELKLDGSLGQPKMTGEITVASAFIRLPELPRNVHQVVGESELWALAAADTTANDSARLFVVPAIGDEPQLTESSALPLPDMDIAVNIPGNFRVSGYGLDIELSGKVKVGRGFDKDGLPHPTAVGQLATVLGTLKFMNRTFDVERGEVIFRGNAPPNPNLSMLLTTVVNGTLVRIMISGKADNPIIELSSEPSYEESDIMAVLLFGQPMNNLDDEQRGNVRNENDPGLELRQNLAGLAVVFGTAGMQNTVTKTVGVDMVEVGADSDGESTLMVGKFISPRLMVKYNHSLTKSGTYFVTMEYTLTRIFRLVSTYGQGEEDSGLELKWSRRY